MDELLRATLSAAIREVTGCPDIRGNGGKLLTDTILATLQTSKSKDAPASTSHAMTAAVARWLCEREDGENDPDAMTYSGIYHEPDGPRWTKWWDDAETLLKLALKAEAEFLAAVDATPATMTTTVPRAPQGVAETKSVDAADPAVVLNARKDDAK